MSRKFMCPKCMTADTQHLINRDPQIECGNCGHTAYPDQFDQTLRSSIAKDNINRYTFILGFALVILGLMLDDFGYWWAIGICGGGVGLIAVAIKEMTK